ncbi:MAG: dUTP diphosphatase [Clostridia bacterium]|nr:dUTP diphosphatase [Clostridia bacterium]
MEKTVIRMKKLDERAIVPTLGTPYAAGADLYTVEGATIPSGGTAWLGTGICIEIPEGFVGLIFARSSLGTKRGLAPANKVGVVDSDYRGEIKVVLHNHSDQTQTVEQGERIAQLVVVPYLAMAFEEVDELDETGRGTKGFGSTGKF